MPDGEGGMRGLLGAANAREGGDFEEAVATGRGIHKAILTLYGTEAPVLVLAVVLGCSTPEVTVLTTSAGAVVEPLAIVQEGEIAGVPVRVALDCVNFWEANRENLFMMEHRTVCFVRKR